jgi:hypothetical protein
MKPSERATHFDAVDAWGIFAAWATCEGHGITALLAVVLCIAMAAISGHRKQREDAEAEAGEGARREQ